MISIDKTIIFDLFPNGVNVVGNASSIFLKQYGCLIDKRPTIRFNRAQIINSNSQGSRWDVLATSELKTIEYYNKNTPTFHTLFFTPSRSDHYENKNKIKFQSACYEVDNNLLLNFIKSKPSTGFSILNLFDSIKYKNLNLFGFDWKATPTFYEVENKREVHNYAEEKLIISKLIKKNCWRLYD